LDISELLFEIFWISNFLFFLSYSIEKCMKEGMGYVIGDWYALGSLMRLFAGLTLLQTLLRSVLIRCLRSCSKMKVYDTIIWERLA